MNTSRGPKRRADQQIPLVPKQAKLDGDDPILQPPHLERLPREVIWEIVANLSVSLLNLRLTSRTIKSHVDSFANHTGNISLINNVTFYGTRCFRISGNDDPRIAITVIVEVLKADWKSQMLLLLRIKLCQHLKDCNRLRIVTKFPWSSINNPDNNPEIAFVVYKDEENLTKLLIESIGRGMSNKIKRVVISFCKAKEQIHLISEILNKKYIMQLEVYSFELTDMAFNLMFNAVKMCKVEHLKLCVGEWATSFDVVSFLHILSTVLSSLHIWQTVAKNVDYGSNYLLGLSDMSWAPIFIEMLSKKLGKLNIRNVYFNYLSLHGANQLIEKLTKLGKRIWFEASCDKFPDGLQREFNEHAIRAGVEPHRSILEIKHVARKSETS